MKFGKALFVCIMLLVISAPVPQATAVLVGESQTEQAITQEPVVNPDMAKLVVAGPTNVKSGDLVVISVENSHAASFKWIVMPPTDNFLVIDNGKRVVFSSGVGGEFKFVVACGLGDTCDVAVHTVMVLGEPVTPADNLASKIALWCDQIDSESRRDECLALAQSFSSVAMVMDGGTLTTPKDIVQATFKSNKDALGDSLEKWQPFRQGLAKELTKMAEAKELTDTASHIKVWKAVASALREYAAKM